MTESFRVFAERERTFGCRVVDNARGWLPFSQDLNVYCGGSGVCHNSHKPRYRRYVCSTPELPVILNNRTLPFRSLQPTSELALQRLLPLLHD